MSTAALATTAVVERQESPLTVINGELQRGRGQFLAALPPHIPVERFMRVVLTAVQGNQDLLKADRRSLFSAAMKAAQDGLLPDGRDGALVTYGPQVQWMPMIGGILKKVRNSGELKSISAHVVYEHDSFRFVLGDEERIEHEPRLDGDRGKARLAYAVAHTKDGGVYREVMTVQEIEQVRSVSRAGRRGPWAEWWGEMAKKTVLRRLAKRLPMSSDLDDLIRRDDELYDLKGGAGADQAERLFAPVQSPLSDTIEHQPAGGDATGSDPDAPAGSGESVATASGDGAGPQAGPAPDQTADEPDDFPGADALRAQAERGARGR